MHMKYSHKCTDNLSFCLFYSVASKNLATIFFQLLVNEIAGHDEAYLSGHFLL